MFESAAFSWALGGFAAVHDDERRPRTDNDDVVDDVRLGGILKQLSIKNVVSSFSRVFKSFRYEIFFRESIFFLFISEIK